MIWYVVAEEKGSSVLLIEHAVVIVHWGPSGLWTPLCYYHVSLICFVAGVAKSRQIEVM